MVVKLVHESDPCAGSRVSAASQMRYLESTRGRLADPGRSIVDRRAHSGMTAGIRPTSTSRWITWSAIITSERLLSLCSISVEVQDS